MPAVISVAAVRERFRVQLWFFILCFYRRIVFYPRCIQRFEQSQRRTRCVISAGFRLSAGTASAGCKSISLSPQHCYFFSFSQRQRFLTVFQEDSTFSFKLQIQFCCSIFHFCHGIINCTIDLFRIQLVGNIGKRLGCKTAGDQSQNQDQA